MNPDVMEQIRKCYKGDGGKEETEKVLERYLEVDPECIEAWMRLAITVFEPPIADYDKSIHCLKRAIRIGPGCLEALFILARIQDIIYREVDEDVFQELHSIQTNDPEEQSMLEYAKAWYYESKEMWHEYENALKRSIVVYPGHVLNHISLGLFYVNQGDREKGKSLLVKGVRNVKHVYQADDGFDEVGDYNEFINERIKGIHVTDVINELWKKTIRSLS
ncbi:tetratricopeptide repeat protein [Polycladomyces sp. WAk]|uniref:Tetratricopeptide repeat protein n=1 Tax=Polycladomyces zharkentensis TaxID=2807616 RepID=A0ABS2WI75_9BACL|nr:tetratricopeptide repeat protein [Polycladomyces sp. WAk]MBN2909213.1 tetratricopeptide repeat protein [Polycladomyces sp. WAk]